ncbi:hypothetical protein BME96_19105 (plasmid) [Virgibacillus halodenitrificans]|uniref:Uncharacterized protein n=1 Tax=Virgibacillus halodenitrificans TaxID=1482 RepID=A0AAC9NMB0_VIRHA|nr:hypothetical protein [Virgibacillus halodenitrificans]APC50392.1 hypothetical protein BME96_19105 [Virgibacillus halodenitrificans]
MIKDNTVDLTGFVYNINFKEYEYYSSIFFTLNMQHRFKDEMGNKVSKFNTVSCGYTSNKNDEGSHNKSFEYFIKHISEGQLLRLQGMISSWTEGLINGEVVVVTEENKKDVKKYIPRNIIRVSDYSFLQKRGVSTKPKRKQEENEKEHNDQVDYQFNDYPDIDFPMYKTIS